MYLVTWGLLLGIALASEADYPPQLLQFFSSDNTTHPVANPNNISGLNTVDKQDLRVETGLFFDLNKDPYDDDCEEEKDDCDGWWFWPFEVDQTSGRPSVPPGNLLAMAQTDSHGLFTGKNLAVSDVTTMKLGATERLSNNLLETYTNSSTIATKNSSQNHTQYTGFVSPASQTLPDCNGALIIAIALILAS